MSSEESKRTTVSLHPAVLEHMKTLSESEGFSSVSEALQLACINYLEKFGDYEIRDIVYPPEVNSL